VLATSSVENVWIEGGGAPAARFCARAPKQIPQIAITNATGAETHVLILINLPPCLQCHVKYFGWNIVPGEYTTPMPIGPAREYYGAAFEIPLIGRYAELLWSFSPLPQKISAQVLSHFADCI
jgi:hypothetical protein